MDSGLWGCEVFRALVLRRVRDGVPEQDNRRAFDFAQDRLIGDASRDETARDAAQDDNSYFGTIKSICLREKPTTRHACQAQEASAEQ